VASALEAMTTAREIRLRMAEDAGHASDTPNTQSSNN